jgi:subtilisin family serine protease
MNEQVKTVFKKIFATANLRATENFTIKTVGKQTNVHKVIFDPSVFDEVSVLNKIKNQTDIIRYAQFNRYAYPRNTEPNDPFYKDQWYLRRILAPAVWDFTKGGLTACGDTIVVAVLDRGFEINHNDLKNNIWKNHFEIPNNGVDDDKNGYVDDYAGLNAERDSDDHEIEKHGTQCAGMIGATGNNNTGIAGINWNIKLLIISGCYSEDDIIEAYSYIINLRKKYTESGGKQGAFVAVTSMSLGFNQGSKPEDFPLTCGIFDTLGKTGILNVVAAANTSKNIDEYGDIPGLCPSENLMVVTRTDSRDLLPDNAGFSPRSVDIAAPGQDIILLSLNNNYSSDKGNSFAAPLVAGSGALLLSMPQDTFCKLAKKTPAAVVGLLKDALMQGAEVIPALKDKTVNGGRLNVNKSFELLKRKYGTPVGDYDILKLYPNPVGQNLFLELQLPERPNVDLIISNALGQIVYQKRIEDADLLKKQLTISISTQSYASGIYGISILTDKFKKTETFMVCRR